METKYSQFLLYDSATIIPDIIIIITGLNKLVCITFLLVKKKKKNLVELSHSNSFII